MSRGRMPFIAQHPTRDTSVATIQLFRPYLESRRARQAVVAAAATKDAHALEKDDVYFQGDRGSDDL